MTRDSSFLSLLVGRHFGKASYLDCKQVVFGRGVEGMDAVQKMATVETDKKQDQPYAMQNIII